MPKRHNVVDPLVINDENDRILELWFRARALAEFCEQHSPADHLFVANIAGQEGRKTLAGALDYAERVPEDINVCLFRRKLTLSLPFLEQLCNTSHRVQLYTCPPSQENRDGAAAVAIKPGKAATKKDRARREEELFAVEDADQLFLLSFDLIDLLTSPLMQHSVSVPPEAMLQDCIIELRCGTPFLPPAKLNKYRPLKIEVRTICDLPGTVIQHDSLFVTVRFAGFELQSPELEVAVDGKVTFRRVKFLGTQSPLEVYQDVFFRRMEVSVFRGARMCLGTGTVQLRAAATDQQCEFSELVFLLPSRTTITRDNNCLTQGTTVSLHVDFFIPLPRPVHVLSDGQPAHGHFLTRGVIRMPYMAKWVPSVLEAFIAATLQLKKAGEGSNIYQYELPEPEPEVLPVKEKKKESAKSHKAQSVPPPRPPSPPSAFETQFKIVSPPGISGFEVMDDNVRIICIEGLAVEVHKVFQRLNDVAGHNPQLELLMNAELFVPSRAYTVFPPLVTLPKIVNADTLKMGIENGIDSADEAVLMNVSEGHVLGKVPVGAASEVLAMPLSVSCKRPTESSGDVFDAAEAEGGGTGGRIHRIRIRETIGSLASQQRYLLRRMLSEVCISCYTKLRAICECSSLRTILERDLFPTSEELIALERSFGVALELCDVFGKQEFVSVLLKEEAVSFSNSTTVVSIESSCLPVRLNALQSTDVGKMVSFEATKVMSSRRRIPACVQQRYPGACWLVTTDTNTKVLCAFSVGAQPKDTIRYFVEAQVVRCGDMFCLYPLACDSLAKSYTDSRNPVYETYLKALRTQQMQIYSNKEQRTLLTSTPSIIGNGPLSDESDSSKDSDVLVNPLPREVPAISHPVMTVRKDMIDKSQRHVQLRAKKVPRLTAADYALCWELYRQRAPTVSSKPPKGPPMHF
ncbi:hypothetical protein TraAM80_00980 [Trypanosoma rangeli]|uniref:Uncharacterized protein n=1 Tax=Trypanosoma rangeli TaxID=5698 RepID=A0A3R7RRH4_TRYRA|nr:uncharacterized protein TraAM80_00980 [Trypanosoma rangeli]RNF11343.1 hypothetical protein TraAM80_00980 [Trypanosoma rangeli]|eukprot:RNF11343.1 hypothetical protein TraAM80_00980 [Trypanosoma rangeli]